MSVPRVYEDLNPAPVDHVCFTRLSNPGTERRVRAVCIPAEAEVLGSENRPEHGYDDRSCLWFSYSRKFCTVP